jgi:hypothetical protein
VFVVVAKDHVAVFVVTDVATIAVVVVIIIVAIVIVNRKVTDTVMHFMLCTRTS